MPEFQTKFERLELKYLINEREADSIRNDIQAVCTPDAYNARGSGMASSDRGNCQGYPIYSCYLDSPGMAFHKAKERGDPSRVKLRIRTYSPTSLASMEIKRRQSAIINKSRVAIDRNHVEDAARGIPVPVPIGSASASVLSDFALVAARSGAEPALTVQYDREAFESRVDHYARVTFDRKIRVQVTRDWSLSPDERAWTNFDDHWAVRRRESPVVLELKCENTPPIWMIETVRKYQLAQSSFSKYSIGVGLCQEYLGLGRSKSRRSLNSMEHQ